MDLESEIVSFVQNHIDQFRTKFDEFCQWVEKCAEELDKYRKDPRLKDWKRQYEILDEEMPQLHARNAPLSREYNRQSNEIQNYEKKLFELVENGANDKAIAGARKAIEKKQTARDSIDHQIKKLNKQAENNRNKKSKILREDWICWNEHRTWQYLNIPHETGYFFAPTNVINPLAWFGFGGPIGHRNPTEEESLRGHYALVAIVHDKYIDNMRLAIDRTKPRVFSHKTYTGRYFERDSFCTAVEHDLQGKDIDKRIRNSLDVVKADLDSSIGRRIKAWVKNHPHSYGLTGGIIFLMLFFVLGLVKAQWRNWCWGTAGVTLLVLILSLLGGRSSR